MANSARRAPSLVGKRALVTGAARGMGARTAEALVREGASVALHARRRGQLDAISESVRQLGGKAVCVTGELTDAASIADFCAEAINRLGGIDIVINNAGVAAHGPVVDLEEEEWDQVMDVNLKAPFLVTQHTLPAMIAQGTGGAYVFNASSAARMAQAERSIYNATKAGLVGFTRCLAEEVGPHGITANAVCAGWIATEMAVELHEQMAEESGVPFEQLYDQGMRVNAMRAIIPPEDVADMMVFLAGPGARHVTAQSIYVCAGRSIV
ncbi:MAG: SDR family NAD(P)-dependent oxidoreductase [Proteobacteria bacterium]|nr:SDR family NAD(P)-dependent oxidoreductase [Pseudomonadota bacterium]MDA1357203.1 SDR family NAD(P)-dependent oxidoreductase [Pseudomonadota bacterium]